MPDTPIYKADPELSKLIERARAGEEVFVATPDDHKARLVPVDEPAGRKEPRQLGLLRGKIWMADDWDSPETNAEIEELFYDTSKFENKGRPDTK
jgi:antitoxin (DNA-binding transcriptional repressor) of toxin-antitoxin stability system